MFYVPPKRTIFSQCRGEAVLGAFCSCNLSRLRNGQVSTIGRKQSSESYPGIDLGKTAEYASIRKTIHRGYTLTKWTRANWMTFDDNWTSYIDLAKFDHPPVHMGRVACW